MKIDVEKSITTGYLEYEKAVVDQVSDVLFVVIYGGAPVVLIIPFFKALYDGMIPSVGSTSMMLISILIGCLFIRHLLELDKLKRTSGINSATNREIIQGIILQSDWEILFKNHHYLLVGIPAGIWAVRRQIAIIFDGPDILLNTTTFGLHDIKSFVHFLRSCFKTKLDV